MNWPYVIPEDRTLDLVLAGRSIARFGDGEFNLCFGRPCITQIPTKDIQKRLRMILENPGGCLVGIPHMHGPKSKFWTKFKTKEVVELLKAETPYGSAFITRPDSAPWIDNPIYWLSLRKLWLHKKVLLVRGSSKSLTKAELYPEAEYVTEIIGPMRDAFESHRTILSQITTLAKTDPFDLILLCLGPTATVLAHQLCEWGYHAVDIGHAGMFLRKHDRGEPMTITEAEKAIDRR